MFSKYWIHKKSCPILIKSNSLYKIWQDFFDKQYLICCLIGSLTDGVSCIGARIIHPLIPLPHLYTILNSIPIVWFTWDIVWHIMIIDKSVLPDGSFLGKIGPKIPKLATKRFEIGQKKIFGKTSIIFMPVIAFYFILFMTFF